MRAIEEIIKELFGNPYPHLTYLKGIICFLSIFIMSGLHAGVAHILFPGLLAKMKEDTTPFLNLC